MRVFVWPSCCLLCVRDVANMHCWMGVADATIVLVRALALL